MARLIFTLEVGYSWSRNFSNVKFKKKIRDS